MYETRKYQPSEYQPQEYKSIYDGSSLDPGFNFDALVVPPTTLVPQPPSGSNTGSNTGSGGAAGM